MDCQRGPYIFWPTQFLVHKCLTPVFGEVALWGHLAYSAHPSTELPQLVYFPTPLHTPPNPHSGNPPGWPANPGKLTSGGGFFRYLSQKTTVVHPFFGLWLCYLGFREYR